jgi:hypothetical protein
VHVVNRQLSVSSIVLQRSEIRMRASGLSMTALMVSIRP